MGTTTDLQFQIDKGEFDIFVLCGDTLDIEANGAEACRQNGNHAAAIFYLYSESDGIVSLHYFVPVEGNQPVRLVSHLQQVAAAIPVHHQSLLLPEIALNRVARQWAAAFGIGDTHALRATDTQCGRLASDGGVVAGAGEMRDGNMG